MSEEKPVTEHEIVAAANWCVGIFFEEFNEPPDLSDDMWPRAVYRDSQTQNLPCRSWVLSMTRDEQVKWWPRYREALFAETKRLKEKRRRQSSR